MTGTEPPLVRLRQLVVDQLHAGESPLVLLSTLRFAFGDPDGTASTQQHAVAWALGEAYRVAYDETVPMSQRRIRTGYFNGTAPADSLRDLNDQVRKAVRLGADPAAVLLEVAGGLTGASSGPVQYAARDAMAAAFAEAVA